MQGTVAHYSNVALRFAHEGINVTFLAAWDIPKCELSHWNKGHLPPLEIRYYLKILLKGKCDERWWWPSAVDIPFERNSVHPTTTYYRESAIYRYWEFFCFNNASPEQCKVISPDTRVLIEASKIGVTSSIQRCFTKETSKQVIKTSLITGVDFSTESSNHHDGPFCPLLHLLQQLVLE